jgi:hypothetical protein
MKYMMQSFKDFQKAILVYTEQLTQLQKQQFALWCAQSLLEQVKTCEDVDENPTDIDLLDSIFREDLAVHRISEVGISNAKQKLANCFPEDREDLEDTTGFALNICEMLELNFGQISNEDMLQLAEYHIGLTDWLLGGTTNYSLETMFTFPEMQAHWQEQDRFLKHLIQGIA